MQKRLLSTAIINKPGGSAKDNKLVEIYLNVLSTSGWWQHLQGRSG